MNDNCDVSATAPQLNSMAEEGSTHESQTTTIPMDTTDTTNMHEEHPTGIINGDKSQIEITNKEEEGDGVKVLEPPLTSKPIKVPSFVSFLVPIRCLSQLAFSTDTCWLGISEESLGDVFDKMPEKERQDLKNTNENDSNDSNVNNTDTGKTLETSGIVGDNVEVVNALPPQDNSIEENGEIKDITSSEIIDNDPEGDGYSAKPKKNTLIIATIPSRKSIVAYGLLLGSRIQRHKLKEREKRDMPIYWTTVIKVGWIKVAECAISEIGLAIDTLQPASAVDPATGYGIITGEKRDREGGDVESERDTVKGNNRGSKAPIMPSANISVGSTKSSHLRPNTAGKSVVNSKTRTSSAAHDPEVKALSQWIQSKNEEELTHQKEASYLVKWTLIPDSLCTSELDVMENKLSSSIDGSSLRLLPNDLRNYFLNPAHGMAIARKNNEAQMKGQHHQFQQRAHLTNQTYHDMYVGSRIPQLHHHQQYQHNSYHNHMYRGGPSGGVPLPNHSMYGSNPYNAPYGAPSYETSMQYGMTPGHAPQQGYQANMYVPDHRNVRHQLPYHDQQQSYTTSNHRPPMVFDQNKGKRIGYTPAEAGKHNNNK
eukprot:Tbor_TRINITY_DN3752_c0_g1::TRINITY_DN3752_c0_g1_i1::g.2366::m.2366